ncbi:MAG: hypothetical protein Q8L51_03690, partial [Candidatus Amesbacteria bacterium]|nr:hypothetical protein [Candidatus Amesbacteria bacterium]
ISAADGNRNPKKIYEYTYVAANNRYERHELSNFNYAAHILYRTIQNSFDGTLDDGHTPYGMPDWSQSILKGVPGAAQIIPRVFNTVLHPVLSIANSINAVMTPIHAFWGLKTHHILTIPSDDLDYWYNKGTWPARAIIKMPIVVALHVLGRIDYLASREKLVFYATQNLSGYELAAEINKMQGTWLDLWNIVGNTVSGVAGLILTLVLIGIGYSLAWPHLSVPELGRTSDLQGYKSGILGALNQTSTFNTLAKSLLSGLITTIMLGYLVLLPLLKPKVNLTYSYELDPQTGQEVEGMWIGEGFSKKFNGKLEKGQIPGLKKDNRIFVPISYLITGDPGLLADKDSAKLATKDVGGIAANIAEAARSTRDSFKQSPELETINDAFIAGQLIEVFDDGPIYEYQSTNPDTSRFDLNRRLNELPDDRYVRITIPGAPITYRTFKKAVGFQPHSGKWEEVKAPAPVPVIHIGSTFLANKTIIEGLKRMNIKSGIHTKLDGREFTGIPKNRFLTADFYNDNVWEVGEVLKLTVFNAITLSTDDHYYQVILDPKGHKILVYKGTSAPVIVPVVITPPIASPLVAPYVAPSAPVPSVVTPPHAPIEITLQSIINTFDPVNSTYFAKVPIRSIKFWGEKTYKTIQIKSKADLKNAVDIWVIGNEIGYTTNYLFNDKGNLLGEYDGYLFDFDHRTNLLTVGKGGASYPVILPSGNADAPTGWGILDSGEWAFTATKDGVETALGINLPIFIDMDMVENISINDPLISDRFFNKIVGADGNMYFVENTRTDLPNAGGGGSSPRKPTIKINTGAKAKKQAKTIPASQTNINTKQIHIYGHEGLTDSQILNNLIGLKGTVEVSGISDSVTIDKALIARFYAEENIKFVISESNGNTRTISRNGDTVTITTQKAQKPTLLHSTSKFLTNIKPNIDRGIEIGRKITIGAGIGIAIVVIFGSVGIIFGVALQTFGVINVLSGVTATVALIAGSVFAYFRRGMLVQTIRRHWKKAVLGTLITILIAGTIWLTSIVATLPKPEITSTYTPTVTNTFTATPTKIFTPSATVTVQPTNTNTPTVTSTNTPVPPTAKATEKPTDSPTAIPSKTPSKAPATPSSVNIDLTIRKPNIPVNYTGQTDITINITKIFSSTGPVSNPKLLQLNSPKDAATIIRDIQSKAKEQGFTGKISVVFGNEPTSEESGYLKRLANELSGSGIDTSAITPAGSSLLDSFWVLLTTLFQKPQAAKTEPDQAGGDISALIKAFQAHRTEAQEKFDNDYPDGMEKFLVTATDAQKADLKIQIGLEDKGDGNWSYIGLDGKTNNINVSTYGGGLPLESVSNENGTTYIPDRRPISLKPVAPAIQSSGKQMPVSKKSELLDEQFEDLKELTPPTTQPTIAEEVDAAGQPLSEEEGLAWLESLNQRQTGGLDHVTPTEPIEFSDPQETVPAFEAQTQVPPTQLVSSPILSVNTVFELNNLVIPDDFSKPPISTKFGQLIVNLINGAGKAESNSTLMQKKVYTIDRASYTAETIGKALTEDMAYYGATIYIYDFQNTLVATIQQKMTGDLVYFVISGSNESALFESQVPARITGSETTLLELNGKVYDESNQTDLSTLKSLFSASRPSNYSLSRHSIDRSLELFSIFFPIRITDLDNNNNTVTVKLERQKGSYVLKIVITGSPTKRPTTLSGLRYLAYDSSDLEELATLILNSLETGDIIDVQSYVQNNPKPNTAVDLNYVVDQIESIQANHLRAIHIYKTTGEIITIQNRNSYPTSILDITRSSSSPLAPTPTAPEDRATAKPEFKLEIEAPAPIPRVIPSILHVSTLAEVNDLELDVNNEKEVQHFANLLNNERKPGYTIPYFEDSKLWLDDISLESLPFYIRYYVGSINYLILQDGNGKPIYYIYINDKIRVTTAPLSKTDESQSASSITQLTTLPSIAQREGNLDKVEPTQPIELSVPPTTVLPFNAQVPVPPTPLVSSPILTASEPTTVLNATTIEELAGLPFTPWEPAEVENIIKLLQENGPTYDNVNREFKDKASFLDKLPYSDTVQRLVLHIGARGETAKYIVSFKLGEFDTLKNRHRLIIIVKVLVVENKISGNENSLAELNGKIYSAFNNTDKDTLIKLVNQELQANSKMEKGDMWDLRFRRTTVEEFVASLTTTDNVYLYISDVIKDRIIISLQTVSQPGQDLVRTLRINIKKSKSNPLKLKPDPTVVKLLTPVHSVNISDSPILRIPWYRKVDIFFNSLKYAFKLGFDNLPTIRAILYFAEYTPNACGECRVFVRNSLDQISVSGRFKNTALITTLKNHQHIAGNTQKNVAELFGFSENGQNMVIIYGLLYLTTQKAVIIDKLPENDVDRAYNVFSVSLTRLRNSKDDKFTSLVSEIKEPVSNAIRNAVKSLKFNGQDVQIIKDSPDGHLALIWGSRAI